MEFGLYQHYKGKFYQVVDIAKHAETLEDMVVYCGMYGKFQTWVRPKTIFEEELLVEGVKAPRFRLVDNLEEEGEYEYELFSVFDNEIELQAAVNLLKKHKIRYSVQRDAFKPKPEYLNNDLFLKVYVSENDFDKALDLFNSHT